MFKSIRAVPFLAESVRTREAVAPFLSLPPSTARTLGQRRVNFLQLTCRRRRRAEGMVQTRSSTYVLRLEGGKVWRSKCTNIILGHRDQI